MNESLFSPPEAVIKVIGVGGGGGNAINTMIRTNIEGVDFIAANTDVQALKFSLAGQKIQIGKELTKGLGAGADPDVGRDAALEDRHAITEALEGAHMVFITAGMGGGTGTGGAAIIAQIAKEIGALTVGVVTKPFLFEGKRRKKNSEAGIERLSEYVDTLISIPNQRLLQIASPDLSMIDAFRMADNVLVNAVKGISDIINIPGTVNVDFADVKTVMSSTGMALMGIGSAEGENRAANAATQAINSPLLEDVDIEGATGLLINISAGENLTLMEVNEACSIVQEAAHENSNIIFGAVIDETLGQMVRVTVIATGFPTIDEIGTEDESIKKSIQASVRTPRPVSPQVPNPEYSLSHAQNSFANEKPVQPVKIDHQNTSEEEILTQLTMSDPAPIIQDEPEKRIFGATVDDAPEGTETFQVSRNEDISNDDESQGESFSNIQQTPFQAIENSGDPLNDKIDQQLDMAEKIDAEQNSDIADDLDIPAFLRTDSKDLSLS